MFCNVMSQNIYLGKPWVWEKIGEYICEHNQPRTRGGLRVLKLLKFGDPLYQNSYHFTHVHVEMPKF